MSSVVVTGAAKGIGAGIVEAFAGAGWSVVAVDRDRAPLEQLASRIGGTAKVVTLAGDVADRATNDAAVKLAIDRIGAEPGDEVSVDHAGGRAEDHDRARRHGEREDRTKRRKRQ